ncbi:MAG: hypothetical protein HRT99_04090, partial [Mycoplasmatales bacterium]|nr:hypothetical protein [Mycoplasmatales bacterium]
MKKNRTSKFKYMMYVLGGVAILSPVIGVVAYVVTKDSNSQKSNTSIIANKFKKEYYYHTNSTSIEKVEDKILANGTLGIILPKNLLGTIVKYSHEKLDSDGDLVVTIKVSKVPENTTSHKMIIHVDGINKAKDTETIKKIARGISSSDVNFRINEPIKEANNIILTNNTLGISLPSYLLGTEILYSHPEINKDGIYVVEVKIQKNNGTPITKQINVNIVGLDKDVEKDLNDILAKISKTNNFITNGKIIPAVSDASFKNGDLGINLPGDLNGVDVKYSHGAINADGTYDVTLK